MIDFFKSVFKYKNYILYSAKCKLKSEVSNSYLNALWWVLNPLIYMLIYIFIVTIVFKKSEPNFPVFVFIGLTIWNYFSRVLNSSVKTIVDNKNIIRKIYIPKYNLLIVKTLTLLFQTFISIFLVFVLLFIFKVHITLKILYFIPILLVLYCFTFSAGLILMHFGVYIRDLKNIVDLLLKFIFYFSGVFYSIPKSLPSNFAFLILNFNPVAFLIDASRECIMYNHTPNLLILSIYFIISIILGIVGLKLIKKHENTYVKVM